MYIPGGPRKTEWPTSAILMQNQTQQAIEHLSRRRMTPRLSNLIKCFSFQIHFCETSEHNSSMSFPGTQKNFNEHVFCQAQLLVEERRSGQDKGIFR